jgi:hypothetical protein
MKSRLSGAVTFSSTLAAAGLVFLFCLPCARAAAGREKKKATIERLPPPAVSEIQAALQRFNFPSLPIPPSEHPRLYLRRQHIPELKQKTQTAEFKETWAKLQKDARTTFSFKDAKLTDKDATSLRDISEASALMYLFEGDPAAARKAIDYALKWINSFIDTPTGKQSWREGGRVMVTGAIVYDWCYDVLSGGEKRQFMELFLILAQGAQETGYPPLAGSSVASHSTEAQLLRDLLSVGIAVYDEDKTVYQLAAGRIFTEILPALKFMYASHLNAAGASYGSVRTQWDYFALFMFERMGLGNIFGASAKDHSQVPYRWLYMRRPDGQMLRDGDTFSETTFRQGVYWSTPTFCQILAASVYQDGYLMGEALRSEKTERQFDSIFGLLFLDYSVKPKAPTDLPLTRYFGSPNGPGGALVARTEWDSGFGSTINLTSRAVIAEMKITQNYIGGHQHLDSGSFQIYYKGNLAIDSGIYSGENGRFGSPHDLNYQHQTVAHNSLLIYDPGEDVVWAGRPVTNSGGQKFGATTAPKILETLLEEWKAGRVLGVQFGPDRNQPDYSYLKGDITAAYTKKVKEVVRSSVFLNLKNDRHPAALIVFDKITSANPAFKKTWLLHSLEEPAIDKNIATVRRSELGYNGKLVNTTLMPAPGNFNLKKIGGRNKEFWAGDKNFPNSPERENTCAETGAWRIELSPKRPAETDYFLNVLQVMDNQGGPEPLPVERIESEKMTGVKIANRIVLFSKDGKKVSGSIDLNLSTLTGEFQCLVTDLETGTWEIAGGGRLTRGEVTDEGGALHFKAVPGRYTLARTSR